MKTLVLLAIALGIAFFHGGELLAQGPINPPGSPGPSMKSLQEIWDKIGELEGEIQQQNVKIGNLRSENSALIVTLLQGQGLSLPWQTTTLDHDQSGGDLAVSPAGHPYISYYDSDNGDLKLLSHDGTAWTTTTIDGDDVITPEDVGPFSSIAFTADGHPSMSYYDITNENLKYAVFDGASWTVSTVDASASDVGKFTSLAYNLDGKARISYYDVDAGNLKLASYSGASWSTAVVDAGGDVGQYTSMAYSQAGHIHISYYDVTNKALKLAFFDGASTSKITIDGVDPLEDRGKHNSIAFSPVSGQPSISYYDATEGDLKYAFYNGTYWTTSTVDGADPSNPEDVGELSSLSFSSSGKPYIAYLNDANSDVMLSSMNGGLWSTSIVDETKNLIGSVSLNVSANGNISVAFSARSLGIMYAAGQFKAP